MKQVETVDLKTIVQHRSTDDVAAEPILEVLYDGTWVLTTSDIWESWTGLRRRNGQDHHGSVRYMDGGGTYTGRRICPCGTCQAHTEAKYRPN